MDLCSLPISEMSRLLNARELSPVELLNAHLQRIDATEGTLNAFITVMREEASLAAKEAERAISRGEYRGPLHGVPVGLKDLFHVRGVRTTSGTRIMADFVSTEDSTAAARLKEAGAIILGKLNMNELALGATGENIHHGDCLNPWDPGHITGGSSSGSGAATAMGQCAAAFGSDTGGSVRIPSSLCGLVGLKPTHGRISLYGVNLLSWSLDHVGPMARTVEDCALMLSTVAGYDPLDPTSSEIPVSDFAASLRAEGKPPRVGAPREYVWDVLSDPVRHSVKQAIEALAGLGASVVEVSIPLLADSVEISNPILQAESIASNGELLREHGGNLDPRVKQRLELGLAVSSTDYIRAQQARKTLIHQTRASLREVDLLAFPTCAIAAPRQGEEEVDVGGTKMTVLSALTRLTRFANLTGYPSVSVPCGFTDDGLPIGLQLVGRPFEEETVLRAAYQYERATEWHLRRPALQP